MDEQKRQLAKEEAIRQGIERGMALMRDDLKMYGVKADGKKILICEAKDYDSLWDEALKNIELIAKAKAEVTDNAQEYLENWKRERANFLNYKKDEIKRLEEFVRFANEAVILEVIEVLDDLEKAAKEINNEGLAQVLKKFQELLKKQGIERVKVEGAFDPIIHEAVIAETQNGTTEAQNTEEAEEKLEEIRAGYTMRGRVIRPARVKITK